MVGKLIRSVFLKYERHARVNTMQELAAWLQQKLATWAVWMQLSPQSTGQPNQNL